MPGPISTNAQFNQVGHDNILRDIEQLYLLIPQSTGDLGKQPIKNADMSGNGAGKSNGTSAAAAPATTAASAAKYAVIKGVNGAFVPTSTATKYTGYSIVYDGIGISESSGNITLPSGNYLINAVCQMSLTGGTTTVPQYALTMYAFDGIASSVLTSSFWQGSGVTDSVPSAIKGTLYSFSRSTIVPMSILGMIPITSNPMSLYFRDDYNPSLTSDVSNLVISVTKLP